MGGQAFRQRHPFKADFVRWGMEDGSIPCSRPTAQRRWCLSADDGNGQHSTCAAWHLPPTDDELVAQYFTKPSHRTFCVVRNPLTKLFSEWTYVNTLNGVISCSQKTFEDWASAALEKFKTSPHTFQCHMKAQVDF